MRDKSGWKREGHLYSQIERVCGVVQLLTRKYRYGQAASIIGNGKRKFGTVAVVAERCMLTSIMEGIYLFICS